MSVILTYTTADPVAGEPIDDIVIPTGETWQIQSISFGLTTSSSAGNRIVIILVYDSAGASAFMQLSSGYVQSTVSETAVYNFAPGVGFSSVKSTTRYVSAPLPTGLTLVGDGMKIQIGAEGSAGLDNFSRATIGYILV